MTILIVMWFAVNQSYSRETQYYPQIAMQAFNNRVACDAAAKQIREAYERTARITVICAPSSL